MNINVISMYPEILSGFCKNPIVGRAVSMGAVSFNLVDIKEHTDGCFRNIDDSPCGGGKGMILRVDAVCNALKAVGDSSSHVVLLSPKGRVFNQSIARELSSYSSLTFVCGHYEGYDARIESYVDECISLGDFILSGGENAAAIICDSVIRLLPGVLKNGVTEDESFESGLLEYDQYTHPIEYEGKCVPLVLLSGNNAAIARFKRISSLMETAKHRPQLLFDVGVKEPIGRSGASVLYFDDCVMKIDESVSEGTREAFVLNWMKDKVLCPEVLGFHASSSCSFLLMNRVKGKMLCDPYYIERPSVLVGLAVDALKNLWSIPVDSSLGNSTAYSLWLKDHEPIENPVFSHGDFCLPNILVGKKGFSYLDVADAGIGDRYCDIAMLLMSFGINIPSFKIDLEWLFSALEIKPDYKRLEWYRNNIVQL